MSLLFLALARLSLAQEPAPTVPIGPEPVEAPEPAATPEPVAEPESVVEPEPVAEPAPEPVAEPAPEPVAVPEPPPAPEPPPPPPNAPPIVATPTLAPAVPTADDDVRCTPGAATDPDGDPLVTTVVLAIAGAPSVEGDVLVAHRHGKGDVITCSVTVSDGTDTVTATSAPVTVRNTPPTLRGVTLNPPTPRTDDVLRCEIGPTGDTDGDPVALAYAWTIDGAPIDVTTETLPADRTRAGAKIACTVTPHDGEEAGAAGSSAVVVENTPPRLLSAVLGPEDARLGATITCTPGEATDVDGHPVTFRTTWTVDGAPATPRGPMLAPRRGAVVGCTVTPWDGLAEGTPVTPAPITVRNTPPKAAAARITPPTPRADATLTCAASGLADGDGDAVTARFAWTVGGAPAGDGETLSGAFRKGQTVACVVTPHDGVEAGPSAPPATVVIADTPPSVSEVALAPADPDTDAVVTATAVASDPDGDPITLAYRWTVGGKPAQGVDERLDGVASFAHGDTVAVAVTATADGVRSTEAVASVIVRNTPPTRPGVALEDPSEAGALVCRVVEPATDKDADPLTYRFAWTLDEQPYAAKGQTHHKGDTVLVSALRLGQEWTCTATAHDGRDPGETSLPEHLVIVDPSAAMGSSHACAIRSDGFVTCWGNRDYGLTEAPPDRFRQVAVGGWHVCAVRQSDRSTACWGHDVYGQSRPPERVFREVAAGGWHTCGIDFDGAITCWGQSSGGRLDGPVGRFASLSAGGKHTCALDDAGAATCWGSNEDGQSAVPAGAYRQISAGDSHTCALDAAGTVTCWGAGAAGELEAPAGPFVQVVTGSRFSCALRADGSVACWGFGEYGQLDVPQARFRRLGDGVDGLCGVTTDRVVLCWGRDQHGAATPPVSLR